MADAFPGNRILRALVLVALLCAIAVLVDAPLSALGQAPSVATSARTLTVTDSINTHLVTHRGANVLHESGRASGTLSCSSLTIQINISYTHAYVNFNCPTSSGTVSGQGETSFYASGNLAYFHGSLNVGHSTGRYARSGGSSLYIKGTLHRGNYAIGASVTGSLKL